MIGHQKQNINHLDLLTYKTIQKNFKFKIFYKINKTINTKKTKFKKNYYPKK